MELSNINNINTNDVKNNLTYITSLINDAINEGQYHVIVDSVYIDNLMSDDILTNYGYNVTPILNDFGDIKSYKIEWFSPLSGTLSLPFLSIWRTSNISTGSSTATQVRLPLESTGTYNFVVNWGDDTSNTITAWNQSGVTHTYANSGYYVISITGTISGFRFNNSGDRLKLISILSWGQLRLGNAGSYFYGCGNLNINDCVNVLNLTGTTTFVNAFRDCFNLRRIRRINEWNTSNITNMVDCFRDSFLFDDEIGTWNVGNVTDMSTMFRRTATPETLGRFNNGGSDSIKNWNVSKVTNMQQMFLGQYFFNQNIGTWNVSNVTNMSQMFNCTISGVPLPGRFNNGDSDSIKNWNVSKVTAMNSMFSNQPSFNQPIGSWNISNVTNVQQMFRCDTGGVFNQPLGSWDITKCNSLTVMFFGQTQFDQNIGSWNTSIVTNMSFMFGGPANNLQTVFNNGGSDSIKNWNVSKVTNMSTMFANNIAFNQNIGSWVLNTGTTVLNMSSMFFSSSFNQPIGSWNTSGVNNMSSMFANNITFNQNIGNWNVSRVNSAGFSSFMSNKTFNDYSTENYDNLLIGWSLRSVQPNVLINFGTIKYTSTSIAARTILTNSPNNWTIIDGGLI